MITRLVSGGQTGVDRAALDVALELGIPCGGWCPRGRRAEDGPIAVHYPLRETPSRHYGQRTRWNVRDADATLLLTWGEPTGGTLLTREVCRAAGKPYRELDLAGLEDEKTAATAIREWLATAAAGGTLNVAGPRTSQAPAIYDRARALLRRVLGKRV